MGKPKADPFVVVGDRELAALIVALLASAIDTCRQRSQCPWRYLEQAIADRRADRRADRPLAPLPQ